MFDEELQIVKVNGEWKTALRVIEVFSSNKVKYANKELIVQIDPALKGKIAFD